MWAVPEHLTPPETDSASEGAPPLGEDWWGWAWQQRGQEAGVGTGPWKWARWVKERRVYIVQWEEGLGKNIQAGGWVAGNPRPKFLEEYSGLLGPWVRVQERVHEFHSKVRVSRSVVQAFGLGTWRFGSADQASWL